MDLGPDNTAPTKKLRVLYLFCGKPRQADIKSWLKRLSPQYNCMVEIREVDISRSEADDLSKDNLWQELFTEVAEGK